MKIGSPVVLPQSIKPFSIIHLQFYPFLASFPSFLRLLINPSLSDLLKHHLRRRQKNYLAN